MSSHPDLLTRLGLNPVNSGACGRAWLSAPTGGELISRNPASGEEIARVRMASEDDYEAVMLDTAATFDRWRMLPAPKRGEIVREIGDELRLPQRRPRRARLPGNGQRSSPKAEARYRR
jgi:aldehyde dehydrogenase (NAD+)